MSIKKTIREKANWGRRFVIFLLILAMFIGGIELLNLPVVGDIFGFILLIVDVLVLIKWEQLSKKLSQSKALKKIDRILFGVKIEDDIEDEKDVKQD